MVSAQSVVGSCRGLLDFHAQGEYTLARVIPNELCRRDTQHVMDFLVLAAPDNAEAGTKWMVEVPKCSRADVARFGARFGQLQQRVHNLRTAWLRTVPHPLCSNFSFRRVAAVKTPVWERHRRLYRGRFHIRPSSIKPCHPSEPSWSQELADSIPRPGQRMIYAPEIPPLPPLFNRKGKRNRIGDFRESHAQSL
jgi:hypothetical protein